MAAASFDDAVNFVNALGSKFLNPFSKIGILTPRGVNTVLRALKAVVFVIKDSGSLSKESLKNLVSDSNSPNCSVNN